MRIALRELMRQPGRFLPVGGALTLLVILLVVLGGFLDGLELGQTGAYRAHEGNVLVFSEDVELQLQRSLVGGDQRDALAGVEVVAEVGGLSQIFTTAGTGSEDDELADVALFGYDLATDVVPEPPSDGGAVVDTALGDVLGVEEGDSLLIGPASVEITVAALVDDLSQGSPTIWLGTEQWRTVVESANPTALPPQGSSQALVARPSGEMTETELSDVAQSVTDTVEGVEVATVAETIGALDVVQQQSGTFAGIIGVTFAVTLLVVALFFALITLERTGLYAVLKAIGARSSDLLIGLSVQALVISIVALVIGVVGSLVFTALLPPEIPVRLVPSRLVAIGVGTVATALIGSLFTLRRILSIDPAEAIG